MIHEFAISFGNCNCDQVELQLGVMNSIVVSIEYRHIFIDEPKMEPDDEKQKGEKCKF